MEIVASKCSKSFSTGISGPDFVTSDSSEYFNWYDSHIKVYFIIPFSGTGDNV